jgi:hypothetical protein
MMTATPQSFGDKLARWTRLGLIAGIAIVAGLLMTNPHSTSLNPFVVNRANAEGGIAAAPGYLVLTVNVGAASRFYIIDTTKKVVCIYDVVGDKLRLVSARRFDFDGDIFDGSIGVTKFARGIEGGNGIDRKEAKEYGEAINKMWEESQKKK